jgi:DNA-binding IclR family transcriptional regulator
MLPTHRTLVRVLVALLPGEGLTATEMAARAGLNVGTVRATLAYMAALNFVFVGTAWQDSVATNVYTLNPEAIRGLARTPARVATAMRARIAAFAAEHHAG